ncbi:MAG: hypothetical protein SGBAC_008179 [Bacillariaceae sp.]
MASEISSEACKPKPPSIHKTLTSLLAIKTNRTCAECRVALVDPLKVHASFCPGHNEIRRNPKIGLALHDFSITHQNFAPPAMKKDLTQFPSDPSMYVNQKFGGHGVFLCLQCAEAHKCLGLAITRVVSVLGDDGDHWTQERVDFIEQSGGNARSWEVYEAYIPERWKQRMLKPSSMPEERIFFVRAKYEALAFTMPPPGRLAEHAWLSILERNELARRFVSPELKNIHSLTPSSPPTDQPNRQMTAAKDAHAPEKSALPNRLIDFFCVVECSMKIHPNDAKKDLSELSSPEELSFWPEICDCYPSQDTHKADTEFPAHLPSFVLPEGCRPSLRQRTPSFFTFVLTTGEGERLYGGCLQIYDEMKGIAKVRDSIIGAGYEGKLPHFLEENSDDASEFLFFSKSLVLLSHYPLFDLFRSSLKQLNMLTLVQSPLPIERYIANLCQEVPLPPRGKIKVQFCLTPGKIISIERPPPNKLPLVNFSYRPLFSTLSVSNIMVVLGCLMEECKVVLLSQYNSILCPVAEAFLSALFPMQWQGIYIPLMPYAMLDLLDAPVPFLVGMSSRYLTEIDPKRRPRDLVFVDLDRDVVQLGIDETTGCRRTVPNLPSRDAIKLRTALEEHGGSAYMLPNSGIKGCIMSGITETILVTNEERPRYARMENVQIDEEALGRKAVFERTDSAYDGDKDSTDIQTTGHWKEDDDLSILSGDPEVVMSRIRTGNFMKMKKPLFTSTKKKKAKILTQSNLAGAQGHLLELMAIEGFSADGIRAAFLRFFVTIFVNYQEFCLPEGQKDLFDESAFTKDVDCEQSAREFLKRVIQTQMFQCFLETRSEDPKDPQIRFFDECILAKLNRSKKTTLVNGGKLATPFLDDESDKVTKTFTPPPPSNLGLPDTGKAYQYGTFPSLDESRFGRIRPPTNFHSGQRLDRRQAMRSSKSFKLNTAQKTQRDLMKTMVTKPDMTEGLSMGVTADISHRISSATKRSVKDLEAALTSIAPSLGFYPKSQLQLRIKGGSTGDSKGGIGKKKSKSMKSIEQQDDSESNHSLPDSIIVPLSRSETIIINARRKQAILLDVIIKIQAICRMYLIKKQYTAGSKPSREGLKSRSAIQIQSHFRRYVARQEFEKVRMTTIMIQSFLRGRKAATLYTLIVQLVAKGQAGIRGFLVRRRMAQVRAGRMAEYRRQIFLLWKSAHVPLSFRTKFWPTILSDKSFAQLRLCESEIHRLVDLSGLIVHTGSSPDAISRKASTLSLDNSTYFMCQHIPKLLSDPAENAPANRSTAEGFERAERLQLHERLDSKTFESHLEALYTAFGIAMKEKKKKETLANLIWTSYDEVGKSVTWMMKIFPELEGALNIAFHDTSSKSRRRFSKAPKVVTAPVDRSIWDEISLEGKTRKHMQEVAHIYITKVPTLMAKLDNLDLREQQKWDAYKTAMMKVYGSSNWASCRREMIREYLTVPQSPEVGLDVGPTVGADVGPLVVPELVPDLVPEGGLEVSPEVGQDFGPLVEPVVAVETGALAGQVVGPEVGSLAGPEVGPDDGPEVGPEAASKVGPDLGPLVEPAVAVEAGAPAGQEVGPEVGSLVGSEIGPDDGLDDGPDDGPDDSPLVGPEVGPIVGPDLGPLVASAMGVEAGQLVGPEVGPEVGSLVEPVVGPEVGSPVGPGFESEVGPDGLFEI